MSNTVRAAAFLGLALASTVGAIYGLHRFTLAYEEQLDRASQMPTSVYVAVASRDLYQGVPIAPDDLYARQMQLQYVPDGVFIRPDHLVGRIPRERILADEVVRSQRLSDPESGLGLNAIIPRGTRAISIEIADGAALAGMLQPTDYVDVLVTLEQDKGPAQTQTMLQAVFVLAVDARMSGDTTADALERRGRGKPTVTLLVSAANAERLAHASAMGDLRLSLRNGLDIEEYAGLSGAALADFRKVVRTGTVVPRPVASPEPSPDCQPLDHVRGNSKDVEWVDAAGLPCDPGR